MFWRCFYIVDTGARLLGVVAGRARVREKPGALVGVPGFAVERGVLAWVKASVFGFADAGPVTASGVCFHPARRFPASCVRFLGAEFGGIGVAVVKLANSLDVVDDIEGADRPCWRAGLAEKGYAHLSPFPARAANVRA